MARLYMVCDRGFFHRRSLRQVIRQNLRLVFSTEAEFSVIPTESELRLSKKNPLLTRYFAHYWEM